MKLYRMLLPFYVTIFFEFWFVFFFLFVTYLFIIYILINIDCKYAKFMHFIFLEFFLKGILLYFLSREKVFFLRFPFLISYRVNVSRCVWRNSYHQREWIVKLRVRISARSACIPFVLMPLWTIMNALTLYYFPSTDILTKYLMIDMPWWLT